MGEMTARDRIAEVVFDSDDGAPRYHSIDDDELSYPLSFWDIHEAQQKEYLQAADRILTIVRQALLSEDAIVAFQHAEDSYEYGASDGWYQAYRAGMSDALDVAFGPDKEG